jgi:hypothetical protein
MALADSVLEYGKITRGLKSRGYKWDVLSKIGDISMDAGKSFAALGKASAPFRAKAEEFELGSKILGLDEKPTMLERYGFRDIGQRSGVYTSESLDREYTPGQVIDIGILGGDKPEAISARAAWEARDGGDWRTMIGRPSEIDKPIETDSPLIRRKQERTYVLPEVVPETVKQEKASWFQRAVKRGRQGVLDAPYGPSAKEREEWDQDKIIDVLKEGDASIIHESAEPSFIKKEKAAELESDYDPKNPEHNKQLIVNAFKLFANTEVKDFKQISQLTYELEEYGFRNLSVSQIWDKAIAKHYGNKPWGKLTKEDKAKIYSG